MPPKNAAFRFESARYGSCHDPDALKFRGGDGFLFISSAGDGLAALASRADIFEEDYPDYDDSVLELKKP